MPPPATGAWSFEDNTRLYQSLTQEQRDANLQPLLPLTSNFSLDYPKVCAALSIHVHPLLQAHISAWQPPPPRPCTLSPVSTSESAVSTLPLPDGSAAAQTVLSPPISARKPNLSPRPAAASVVKAGKKVEAKTPASKAGKREEVAAVVERKDEVEKKEDIPADERDTIALTHTSIDEGTIAALAITLAVNRHIRCLRLQYSTMTEAAVRMMPTIVSKSCVQRLYIDRITLASPSDTDAPHPLLLLLPALAASNVQLLSLTGNGLTDTDGAAIASVLTSNTMLGALTLSNNHLAAATTASLAAALLLNTALAYVNLSHNPITAPHMLTLLASFTATPIDPPPKATAASKAAQPPPPYRVQAVKDSKGAAYREANGTVRQLWCGGCGMSGGELVERVRQVVAASRAAAVIGAEVAAGVGQCNGLERLGLEDNDWDSSEWSELCAMAPIVSVETERVSKHVRTSIAPPIFATAATNAIDGTQADVAAA